MNIVMSRRRQTLLALTVIVLWMVGFLLTQTPTPTAQAANPPAAKECGPGDSHRAKLTTYNGKRTLNPCISDVTMRLNVGSPSLLGPVRWSASEIRRIGKEKVQIGGKTVELWHFSLKEFRVLSQGSLTSQDASGYEVSLKPESTLQLGGQNDSGEEMYTDVWITRGEFALPSILGALVIPHDSPLVELVQGADLPGSYMQLDIKYLVTSGADPSQQGNYPLRAPNTTLSVK